jgi:MFS family permease
MFGLATVALFGLPRSLKDRLPSTNLESRLGFWQELQLGLKLIRSERWIGFAIRQLTITQGIVSVVLTLAPALSVALLHLPLQHSSQYLIIPAGLGMVVGVVGVEHLAKRWSRVRVLELGLVVAGAALALLGLTGQLYRTHHGHSIVPIAQISLIVAVLVFMLGMLNAVISSTAQTLLQERSSDEVRGKVFGSLNMFINMAATLPILIIGAATTILSVTEVVVMIGAGVVGYALVQLRQISRYRQRGELAEYENAGT